jgi:hypothetical protein
MPYKSKAQAAYILIQAKKGKIWAKKFVKDAKGTHVQKKKKNNYSSHRRTFGD